MPVSAKDAKKRRRQKKRKAPPLDHERPATYRRVPRSSCAVVYTGLHYYVVYTKPRAERTVARRLEEAGIVPYVPQVMLDVTKRGRRLDIERALFPGYVFAGLGDQGQDPDEQYPLIRGTNGVLTVIRNSRGEPARIPARLLRAIESDLSKADEERMYRPGNPRRVGELLRVVDGPFASFLASVATVLSETRIKALVDVFGRKVPVEFETKQLEPV